MNDEILAEGKYIRMIRRNGWEMVERHNCTGIAVIVAKNNKDEVVLVEQFRPPVGCKCIELPAGLVNDDEVDVEESMETAARREFLEETGYEVETMQHIIDGPTSAGLSANVMDIFIGSGLKKIHAGGGVEGEGITVHEIPLDRVDTWLNKKRQEGYLIDFKIYAGLYWLTNPNALKAVINEETNA